MTIYEIIAKMTAGEMAGWAILLVIILFSLVQISPIKLNPWDTIFSWVGKKVNGKMHDQLEELQKQVSDLWIDSHRQAVLSFARECRDEISHDREEWNHILSVAEEYRVYCDTHNVSNGVVKEDTEYIRGVYQELSREHKI